MGFYESMGNVAIQNIERMVKRLDGVSAAMPGLLEAIEKTGDKEALDQYRNLFNALNQIKIKPAKKKKPLVPELPFLPPTVEEACAESRKRTAADRSKHKKGGKTT